MMSSEGMPRQETSFLAAPLALAARLVVRYPVATLLAAVAVALVAGVVTSSGLGFRTSRLDLLNPKSGYNKLWIEYLREFQAEDDAVVVVEGPSAEATRLVLDELAAEIVAQGRYFHGVLHRIDLDRVQRKGLYHLPPERLAGVEQFVAAHRPLLAGDGGALTVAGHAVRLMQQVQSAATLRQPGMLTAAEQQARQLAQSLLAMCEPEPHYLSPWPAVAMEFPPQSAGVGTRGDAERDGGSPPVNHRQVNGGTGPEPAAPSRYLTSRDGRTGFILLRLADTGNQFDRGSEAIDQLRKLIDKAATRHSGVMIGLTGLPVMENDEMRESETSMWWANVASVIGVSVVVIVCFGGIRHPLLASLAFLLALAWSFGYITLVVGHLNILSAAFGVILIGIGMDFGLHFVARYVSVRREIGDCGAALVEAARSVGPGIVTGGITTALAFFTVAFTDFTGIVELGVISGGGVLLCIVAAMIVLPALVYLCDRQQRFAHPPEPLPVDAWLAPIFRVPRLTLVGCLAATVALAVGILQLRYDHNLLNLQPAGLESVELEQRILQESQHSVWYAVSVADSRAELLRRQALFDKLPSVQRTESIVGMLPEAIDAKVPMVQRISEQLSLLPKQPPPARDIPPGVAQQQLADLASVLDRAAPARETVGLLRQAMDAVSRLRPEEFVARAAAWQQQSSLELSSRLQGLAVIADPEPPSWSDLPASLVQRFVGRSGKHLLRIYGRGDIWDMANLERFVTEVKRIDPHATGQPLQTYYASTQMQQSYLLAAAYALVAVSIAVLLDFGNLRDALLSLIPMVLGVVQMFGLMGWFNIPLNAANMVVLPLLLGIGLDTGVHVVHDFRCQGADYRIHRSTAVAVLITALTTMVGFGSLMLASHRGLESLGRVMTIGATCCLVTSIVVLPALLTWLSRREISHSPTELVGDTVGLVSPTASSRLFSSAARDVDSTPQPRVA